MQQMEIIIFLFLFIPLQIKYLVNKAKITKAKKDKEAAEAKVKAEKEAKETGKKKNNTDNSKSSKSKSGGETKPDTEEKDTSEKIVTGEYLLIQSSWELEKCFLSCWALYTSVMWGILDWKVTTSLFILFFVTHFKVYQLTDIGNANITINPWWSGLIYLWFDITNSLDFVAWPNLYRQPTCCESWCIYTS